MALATCELIWLRQLLQELRFRKDEQIKLVCDNQVALHIASNPVFMKGPSILKLTVTSLERRSHQDVWRLVLSIQLINQQIFLLNLSEVLELNTFVTSLIHITYMLQLEGECQIVYSYFSYLLFLFFFFFLIVLWVPLACIYIPKSNVYY